MPDFDGFEPGNTCWIDLCTSDLDGAIEFYTNFFPWKPDEQRPGYTEMTIDGKVVTAILPLVREGQPVAWSTYISVDNSGACADRVREAGGQVLVAPTPVDELGKYAVFADSVGSVFCTWESGTNKGVELANETNTWGYSEVLSSDIEATQSFYRAVFGWEAKSNEEWGMSGWSWYLADKHLGGLTEPLTTTDGNKITGWLNYFGVSDVDAAIASAARLGGSAVAPVVNSPIGQFVTLQDPQGAYFGVANVQMS